MARKILKLCDAIVSGHTSHRIPRPVGTVIWQPSNELNEDTIKIVFGTGWHLEWLSSILTLSINTIKMSRWASVSLLCLSLGAKPSSYEGLDCTLQAQLLSAGISHIYCENLRNTVTSKGHNTQLWPCNGHPLKSGQLVSYDLRL